MLIEDVKICFVAWQHQQRGGVLGVFQGHLDKLLPELGENCLVRQIRAPYWVPETLGVGNGLVTFRRSGQPLQEIVRQFRVLAVAADHIARARRLWRAPYQPAVYLHSRYETTELLPFDFALRIGVPIAHERGHGHHREGLPAGPEGINLRCPPALNVRRHVFDDGGKVLHRLNALRGVDTRPHVFVEPQPAEVDWKIPVREVQAAISQGAVEILIKRFAPACLALLRVKKLGQLLPLGHCLRAAWLPTIFGLKFFLHA